MVPAAKSARAWCRPGGRSRLPTWSARNGGDVRRAMGCSSLGWGWLGWGWLGWGWVGWGWVGWGGRGWGWLGWGWLGWGWLGWAVNGSEQAVRQAEVHAGQLARGGQVLRGDVTVVHGHVPVVPLQPRAALGRRGRGGGEDDLDGLRGELAGLLDHREQPDVVFAGERFPGPRPARGPFHVLLPRPQHDRLGRVGKRQRVAERPLVVRVGVPGHLRREVGELGRDDLLVLLQRGAGRADHRDDQAGVVHRVDPAAVQRAAVQGGAGGHGLAVGPVGRRGAVRRHEHRVGADAVRPAGVHAEGGPAAPVV